MTFKIKRIAFKAELHIIMKILVKAIVRANGLHHFIGGINPPIFKGKFEVNFSEEFIRSVSNNLGSDKILETEIRGLRLQVVRLKKKKGLMRCVGTLPSVSPRFFKKLQREGWILDEKAAALYRYPSEEREKSLKAEIKKYRKEARELEELMRSCGTRRKSQKGKKITPYLSFETLKDFFETCKQPKS